MLVTLGGFIAGSAVGAAHAPWWQSLPELEAVSLVESFGSWPALAISLAAFGAISAGTIIVERRRHGRRLLGPTPDRHGLARVLSGPWPLVAGAVGLALANFATLALAGRPWGITSGFALWGSKTAALIGFDPASWTYWSSPAQQASLVGSVFEHTTSVMNFRHSPRCLDRVGIGGSIQASLGRVPTVAGGRDRRWAVARLWRPARLRLQHRRILQRRGVWQPPRVALARGGLCGQRGRHASEAKVRHGRRKDADGQFVSGTRLFSPLAPHGRGGQGAHRDQQDHTSGSRERESRARRSRHPRCAGGGRCPRWPRQRSWCRSPMSPRRSDSGRPGPRCVSTISAPSTAPTRRKTTSTPSSTSASPRSIQQPSGWRSRGSSTGRGQLALDELRGMGSAEVDAGYECSGNSSRIIQGWPATGGGPACRCASSSIGSVSSPKRGSSSFPGADKGPESVDFRGRAYEIEQHFARSLSRADGLASEPLLAYALNGEPLTREQGAPLRLVVPGWYGVSNVKWLTHIRAQAERFLGKYQARWYPHAVGRGDRWRDGLARDRDSRGCA